MESQIQKILITGTSSGLGNQLARTLIASGHTVIATMRNLTGKNSDTATDLSHYSTGQPGKLHLIEMDVSDDLSVDKAIQSALTIVSSLDIVINNAGIGAGGLSEAFSVEQLRLTLDVNVLGIHRVMRAILPSMRQHKHGLIINISSGMGRMVVPFAGPYTASKFAVEGLSESYRYELAGSGVDVVIVEPGGFMTNYWSSMMLPDDQERVASYGATAQVSESLWKGIPTMLNGAESADPGRFADAIVDLIAIPVGQRPIRLVVDPFSGGQGPKAINGVSEQVQRQVLPAFGLTELLSALPATTVQQP
jgi:NAD(P)-dependent dehydrogenase (short-subunit alcohol dehydrogenase family)